jgi:exosortase
MRSTTTWGEPPSISAAWFVIPAALAVALYAPLVPSLVWEWLEFPNLSHGLAIPLIAGYLVWARRAHLRTVPIEPSLGGLPILALGLATLVVGVRGEEPFLARISLPVTLFGLVVALAGWRMAKGVAIGIVYLVFMIPLPWATLKLMTYRSRLLDATMSAYGLQWLGVPVYRDGVYLHLPTIVLEVADECSSIPAIAALLALGVAYASLTSGSLARRVVLVLGTLPLAIGSNIIRITSTAAGAYYVGQWTLRTAYHMFNGTVNFLLTLVLLMLLDGALRTLTRGWARWRGGA